MNVNFNVCHNLFISYGLQNYVVNNPEEEELNCQKLLLCTELWRPIGQMGICRVCFNEGLYNISSYHLTIGEQKISFENIFKEFSQLETWNCEECPSMMCNSCMDQLIQSYIFVRKLRSADERIKRLYVDKDESEETGFALNYAAEDYEIIEFIDEGNSTDVVELAEDCTTTLYQIPESDISSDNVEGRKPIKRKVNNNKNPHFVLTESVTNILSNAQKLSSNLDDSEHNQQPPIKISKTSSEEKFLITKFVPAQTTITTVDNLDQKQSNYNDALGVNEIRMFDMSAVEVNASEKIELEEDEESNVEDPNTVYMCQYCPRAFSTSHHLIMHTRKSHVCQFCMKGFSKVSDLHKHTRESHNQFNCVLCKKDFSSNSNLRQHMKRVHNVELPAHVSLLSFKRKESNS